MSSSSAASSSHSSSTSQLSSTSTPLTSLLHQKLTTSSNPSSAHHQNQIPPQQPPPLHQIPKPVTAEKQVILNDIASGLESAVARAVSDAVSSVHQQMNNQDILKRQLDPAPPSPPLASPRNHFSHLRQQLESKESSHSASGCSSTLRKRLSNINIEAAVATAVNRYLTTTIKNNQKLTRNQLDHDENVMLIDGKSLIKY